MTDRRPLTAQIVDGLTWPAKIIVGGAGMTGSIAATTHSPDTSLRGTCRSAALDLAAEDPTLTAVAGWYHDATWGREEHWWCVRADGTIVDPTAAQFPSNGTGHYEQYAGAAWCLECGTEIPWQTYMETGAPICSGRCYGRMVGVPL